MVLTVYTNQPGNGKRNWRGKRTNRYKVCPKQLNRLKKVANCMVSNHSPFPYLMARTIWFFNWSFQFSHVDGKCPSGCNGPLRLVLWLRVSSTLTRNFDFNAKLFFYLPSFIDVFWGSIKNKVLGTSRSVSKCFSKFPVLSLKLEMLNFPWKR